MGGGGRSVPVVAAQQAVDAAAAQGRPAAGLERGAALAAVDGATVLVAVRAVPGGVPAARGVLAAAHDATCAGSIRGMAQIV